LLLQRRQRSAETRFEKPLYGSFSVGGELRRVRISGTGRVAALLRGHRTAEGARERLRRAIVSNVLAAALRATRQLDAERGECSHCAHMTRRECDYCVA
jgi:hypothetical protein